MKPFQKFFLAPAALGLLSPLAANANELNLDAVNQYASQEQVTSISQFSDVQPTDWAYQALSNLIERYGCVAGYPNGTYKGGQAMTRYEAAALLNACLDRITEVTDELKRLMKEFEKELAVLRGRVDGLEAKVGELEATQFSTTTKLSGEATFLLGAYAFGGSAGEARDLAREEYGATVFVYDVRLNFDTSFTGKDLLRTRLRAGNWASSAFDGPTDFRSLKFDKSFESDAGPNVVDIDRLYYTFPVGDQLKFTLGARARNTELLALKPVVYKSDLLDFFTGTFGASGTYNKETGAAVGAIWKQKVKKGNPYLAAAVNYVAKNAANGNPGEGGVGTDNSAASFMAQLGGAGKNWGLSAAYRYGQCGTNLRSGTGYTYRASRVGCDDLGNGGGSTNNFAVSAYWQPSESGWVPSISGSWGISTFSDSYKVATDTQAAQSWMVGLQWSDVFVKGNNAGMAVGQAPFTTSAFSDTTPQDGNYVWEWWYKFQVTDNISVTPALVYQSRPLGQNTPSGKSLDSLGGVVQVGFKF
ncbi:carbohydrate porin [Synechococcus sp. CBW1002]|uniref:iron uptake porin n=1 Tax=unclassified Synechococcus TaxID=2626047 RepID=UPI0018CFBED1|nr:MULTISPECIES: iron uptake porin [unclassified Synechococcus]QPN60330.1 carbohydrate porin [Synechococcus sp. CBW1002]QPN67954.1 carbohydrate porin [Synechococcus sp. CBW1006]